MRSYMTFALGSHQKQNMEMFTLLVKFAVKEVNIRYLDPD